MKKKKILYRIQTREESIIEEFTEFIRKYPGDYFQVSSMKLNDRTLDTANAHIIIPLTTCKEEKEKDLREGSHVTADNHAVTKPIEKEEKQIEPEPKQTEEEKEDKLAAERVTDELKSIKDQCKNIIKNAGLRYKRTRYYNTDTSKTITFSNIKVDGVQQIRDVIALINKIPSLSTIDCIDHPDNFYSIKVHVLKSKKEKEEVKEEVKQEKPKEEKSNKKKSKKSDKQKTKKETVKQYENKFFGVIEGKTEQELIDLLNRQEVEDDFEIDIPILESFFPMNVIEVIIDEEIDFAPKVQDGKIIWVPIL